MKPTITNLLTKYNEAKKVEEDTIAFIAEKKAIVEGLKAEELKAAEAGDLDQYKALKAQRNDIEDTIFVKEKVVEKNKDHYVDAAEVAAAWNIYSKEYSAELAKKTDAVNKAAKAFCDAFRELVSVQETALVDREACGKMRGIDESEVGCNLNPDKYYNDFQMPFIKPKKYYGLACAKAFSIPELSFFLASGLMDEKEVNHLGNVIENHNYKNSF